MAESIFKVVERWICSLSNELQYIRNAKSNVELLRNKLKSLDRRMIEVDIARDGNEVIAPNVLSWREHAEGEKKKVELFLGGLKISHVSCCFTSKCLNLKHRYSTGKKADMMASEVSKLVLEGEVSYPMPIPMPNLIVQSFESRMSIEAEIMEALLDESISVIGVCGVVGVGKTTIIRTIANDVKEDKIFDDVVMAFESQNPNILKIQDELASTLNLSLDESSVAERAGRLKTRLKNEPHRILVILDDIWGELDLSTIGFPDKDMHWPKGLKVILLSRQLDVCRKMKVQKMIQVEPVSEEESWSLFQQVAKINDAPEAIQEIAKILANKCYGLPLAIVSIGTKLRDKEVHAWQDCLDTLNEDQGNFEPLQMVLNPIELSYKSLHFESKSLLLICSLFPEGYAISIEDLTRYAKGLQLFKGINLLQETRKKLKSIINILTDCFFLLKCGNDRLKLHGMVLMYCLSIASSDKDMPKRIQKDANDFCNAMILGFDELALLSSPQLKSTQLQLLKLSSGEKGLSTSTRDFPEGMEKLEVLEIDSTRLLLSQKSVQSLVSLRTLSLNYCSLESDLSAIASLQNLEILSFYGSTYVEKFPNEINELKHLKSLDLRFLKGPTDPLPSGILIHFKKLEELYLGSLISEEIIVEIVSLSHLNTIQVLLDSVYELAQLLKSLEVDRLIRFCIFVSSSKDLPPYYFVRRLVVEEVSDDIYLDSKMKALARRCVDGLVLRKIRGLNNLVKDFVDEGNSFQELKNLEVIECDMKFLGDAATPEIGSFVELEKLNIRRAAKLEGLYPGNFPPTSFCKLQEVIMRDVPLLSYLWNPKQSPNLSNLRKLEIDGGKVIRSLFFRSLVKCLYQLQIIKIKNCPKLETIISSDDQERRRDTPEDIAQLAKLKEVYLDGVRSFRRFYCDLLNNEVNQPSTRILCCSFPKLQFMRISRSQRLEIVFDFEGLVRNIGAKEYVKGLFYHLNSLEISDLPRLRRLWGRLPKDTIAFQNLATIVVEKCRGLEYLLTPSMAKMLVSLRSLKVICCDKMKAIIGKRETNNFDIVVLDEEESEEEGNDIFLKYLCHVEVFDLPMLRMLSSESLKLHLPSWNEFVVAFCPRMSKFCQGTLLAPELKEVDCLPYRIVSFEIMSNFLEECENKQRCLNCAIREIRTCGHLDEHDDEEEASFRLVRTQFIKARDLAIAWGDNLSYWEWLPISYTNRSEIARLINVCWFDIRAKVDTKLLMKKSEFIAYLVYEVEDDEFNMRVAKARATYSDEISNDDEGSTVFFTDMISTRADGHLEIELGRFYTRYTGVNNNDHRFVDIRLFNTDGRWKRGIRVIGVEVRSS